MSKRIFSDEDINFIVDNYKTMQYKDIASVLGKTERQVRGKINGLKLTKLRSFDKRYFCKIDTPTKAYWLGFIYADGYIVYNQKSRNYEVSIELQQEDRYILKYLRDEIGGDHKVIDKVNTKSFNGYTYTTQSSVLRIYSKDIARDLINNGVVPNKTSSDIYPECRCFFKDFIRGFLDGDGSIVYNNKDNPTYVWVKFTSSNNSFLNYIKNEITDHCEAVGHISKESENKYNLLYCKKDESRKILDWIYYDDGCPMLYRKYNRYLSVRGLAA